MADLRDVTERLAQLAIARDELNAVEGGRNALIRSLLIADCPVADIARCAGLHSETIYKWRRTFL